MGVIAVKFVIMQKRMNFLHYILYEDINSMIKQVFNALRKESWKGDFIAFTNTDLADLIIDKPYAEITDMTKKLWKKVYQRNGPVCCPSESSKRKRYQRKDM